MAATASNGYYYGAPVIGRVNNFATANTARDGTGTLSTVVWVGTAGSSTPPAVPWVLKRIDFVASHSTSAPDLADCLVHAYITDGTTITPWTDWDPGNPAAASTTATAIPTAISPQIFADVAFPASSYPLFGLSVAPTAGGLSIVMFGELANV